MGLVLGFLEGDSTWIMDKGSDHKVTLERILGPGHFRVSVEGPMMVNKFEITEGQRVQIYPELFISIGSGGGPREDGMVTAKIVFEAPKTLKILRDKLYQEQRRRKA